MTAETLPDTTEDSRYMKNAFHLAIDEIETVLSRKKAITDVTRVAASTASSYAKIRQTEIHDKGLEIIQRRFLAGK